MGIQYTINTAREIIYWPQMQKDLTEAVQSCNTCQEGQDAQGKEPMMSYPIPRHPWQIVAADCFEIKGTHYLVLADFYSDFIEICKLSDMSAHTLIECMKPIFATMGVPTVLISDNGTNFASSEFRQFARAWDFKHTTSSPQYPKSNGKAESGVKIMKKIFRRAKQEEKDKWLALLEWRNTVTPGMNSSPVQRLMARRTRSLLPCAPSHYDPEVQPNVIEGIVKKKKVAKSNYDKGAKQLPKLVIGQPVRVKTHPQLPHSDWKPGTVVKEAAPRSYIVDVAGHQYRRNRVHVRDTLKAAQGRERSTSPPPPPVQCKPDNMPPEAPPSPPRATPSPRANTTSEKVDAPAVVTRSGRPVKVPARFKDFI
jgi:hypothetical protein